MKAIVVLGASVERMKKRFEGALSLYLQDPESSIMIFSGKDWKDLDIKRYVSSKFRQYDIKYEEELESKSTEENAINSFEKMEGLGISEASIVGSCSQAARTRKFFKRWNRNGYKLNFYGTAEGLKTSVAEFPWEYLKYVNSILPKIVANPITKRYFKT